MLFKFLVNRKLTSKIRAGGKIKTLMAGDICPDIYVDKLIELPGFLTLCGGPPF